MERSSLRSGNAGLPDLSYYDFVLAVLPLPLLLGLLFGEAIGLSPRTGLSIGAMLSAAALAHVLFRNPPTRRGPTNGRSA